MYIRCSAKEIFIFYRHYQFRSVRSYYFNLGKLMYILGWIDWSYFIGFIGSVVAVILDRVSLQPRLA